MPEQSPAPVPTHLKAFGGARMAVGAASWIAPDHAARAFGLDPSRDQPIVSQLFGARDFALGFLTATGPPATRTQVLRVGVALDVADAIASLRQIRAGNFSTTAKVLIGAGAASFAAFGVAALKLEESA